MRSFLIACCEGEKEMGLFSEETALVFRKKDTSSLMLRGDEGSGAQMKKE